jgi:hypothetical protein
MAEEKAARAYGGLAKCGGAFSGRNRHNELMTETMKRRAQTRGKRKLR